MFECRFAIQVWNAQQAANTLQHSVQPQNSPTGPAVPQWFPPSKGRFKCNNDTSFSEQFQRTGIGMCLRDDSGTFVLAKVMPFDQVYPITVGEALGLYHAIQWMQNMQFSNIDFELDSKITRDVFHSRMTNITKFGKFFF